MILVISTCPFSRRIVNRVIKIVTELRMARWALSQVCPTSRRSVPASDAPQGSSNSHERTTEVGKREKAAEWRKVGRRGGGEGGRYRHTPNPGRSSKQSVFLKAAICSAQPLPFPHPQSPILGRGNWEHISVKPMPLPPLGTIRKATFPLWVPNWEYATASKRLQ